MIKDQIKIPKHTSGDSTSNPWKLEQLITVLPDELDAIERIVFRINKQISILNALQKELPETSKQYNLLKENITDLRQLPVKNMSDYLIDTKQVLIDLTDYVQNRYFKTVERTSQ